MTTLDFVLSFSRKQEERLGTLYTVTFIHIFYGTGSLISYSGFLYLRPRSDELKLGVERLNGCTETFSIKYRPESEGFDVLPLLLSG